MPVESGAGAGTVDGLDKPGAGDDGAGGTAGGAMTPSNRETQPAALGCAGFALIKLNM